VHTNAGFWRNCCDGESKQWMVGYANITGNVLTTLTVPGGFSDLNAVEKRPN